jgi:hypothetical protein
MVRDFADWIWSAYNYWCDPTTEEECGTGQWAIAGTHQRSAHTFHDIVQGSLNGTFVSSPLRFKAPCTKAASLYQKYVGQLWGNVTKESTIVLSSEDFEQNSYSVWKQIAEKVGIKKVHPGIADFMGVKYNTQLQKERGAHIMISASDFKPGVYEISNFEPMYPATRKILDQCWIPDCHWVSKITGYQYHACSADNKENYSDTKRYSVIIVCASCALYLYMLMLKLMLMLMFTLMFNSRRSYGASKFENDTIAPSSFPSYFKYDSTLTNGYLRNKIKDCKVKYDVASPSAGALTVAGAPETNQKESLGILLVSTIKIDRDFIRRLLKYTLGYDIVFDIEDADASKSRPCSDSLVVSVSPSHLMVIEPGATAGPDSAPKLKTKPGLPCQGVLFDRAILFVRDSLVAVWNTYQKRNGHEFGITGKEFKRIGLCSSVVSQMCIFTHVFHIMAVCRGCTDAIQLDGLGCVCHIGDRADGREHHAESRRERDHPPSATNKHPQVLSGDLHGV